ncbi:sulfatase [Reichenbachiella sp.]|uniref:sulfatase family protein n=2 Tax=Reichenbachiella sp. TaxID=2184521 RepID=UPI00329853E1
MKITHLLLLSSFLLASCVKDATEKKPNLLVIFPDQWRAQAMGFMGEDPVLTPNIDKLAGESIVFTEAVANYPLCSPMRAMFLTGKYPFQNGVYENCMSNEIDAIYDIQLAQDQKCWSDVLKEKGYSQGYIGKWHLEKPQKPFLDCLNNKGKNKWNEWTSPQRRHGFDYWYAYNTYDYHLRPLYWSNDAGREDFHYVDQWSPIHEADMAINYLENKNGKLRDESKPFSLVVAMNPPHDDGEGLYEEVPQKYIDYYGARTFKDLAVRPNARQEDGSYTEWAKGHIKNYFAMVTGVDEQIGRILQSLKKQGLDENTIVMLIADHGDLLGSHNTRGKEFHYEESMRIPLFIRWPEKLKPRSEDLMLSIPDIYPTILTLMGFEDAIPKEVTGRNFAQYLITEKGNTPQSQLYIRVKDRREPDKGLRGVRTQRYTLAIDHGNYFFDGAVLHDNISDPYQMENIATEKPEIVDSLKIVLKDWLEKTNDPFSGLQ